MTVVLLTSASGAPGVTTTALGLACTWPRPAIVVEADPVGGSGILAGFFRGFKAPSQSVVDLVMAHRAGRLAEQFPLSLVPVEGTTAAILPGPRSHAQAFSAQELWEPLALAWKGLGAAGTDVLVDAGRLGMEWYAEALLSLADLVLLVTRADLASLAAARQWAERAIETRQLHPETPGWAVLVVGGADPYSPREVAQVIGLPVVAQLPFDPKGAAVYSRGAAARRHERLGDDLIRCGERIRELAGETQRVLAPKGGS